jgi:hypothetical protein
VQCQEEPTPTVSNLKRESDKPVVGKLNGFEKEKATALALVEQMEGSRRPTAETPVVVKTPPSMPASMRESQSVVFFWKTDQGPVESRIAKVKGDGDVVEIMSEDEKLPILGSSLVLVIAPLDPGRDIEKLTKEQVDLALSRYEKAEKMDELKTLLADDRTKRTVIQTPPEASLGVSAQGEPLPKLDVPTAAGLEDLASDGAEFGGQPEAGWRTWISWAKSFAGKAWGR